MSNPYLSIVIAGRNDNYGGDFRERLQHCFNQAFIQLTQHKIQSEIIFVNYNPLPEPDIQQFIEWKTSNKFISVKIITVPQAVHAVLLEKVRRKSVPMLEYCAKNAGIRKAKGDYILCINPDIVLPKQFFKSVFKLQKNSYYCADRIDFKNYENARPAEFFRIFMKGHSYDFKQNSYLYYLLLRLKNYFRCQWKYHSVDFRNFFERRNWNVYYHNIEYRYHCNVSGDFMLMHRDNWEKLHGYNEQSFLSLHVDALMVIQAASLGLQEKTISHPLYHREHARRYDATEENPEYREVYLSFQSDANKMIADSKPIIYNKEDWGLKNFSLDEKIV
ncbi:MAG: hypothetical protein POELPBGB_03297 [Bacteroidia bacterium]|nr:hypothetical protein [Bacteroidia bacterium]